MTEEHLDGLKNRDNCCTDKGCRESTEDGGELL